MEVVVSTGATSCAKLQSNHHHQQTNIQFFTGRMPFLSPNQQCQSTEWKISHPTDLLTPSSLGSLPTLSLTTNSSRLPGGAITCMAVESPYYRNIQGCARGLTVQWWYLDQDPRFRDRAIRQSVCDETEPEALMARPSRDWGVKSETTSLVILGKRGKHNLFHNQLQQEYTGWSLAQSNANLSRIVVQTVDATVAMCIQNRKSSL